MTFRIPSLACALLLHGFGAAVGQEKPTSAPDVTVEGDAAKPTGGKVVDDTALKMPEELRNIPRSLTVIDAERFRQQNVRSIPESLAYVPGMSINSYRTGGYHFYARGYRMLPDDTKVDGFPGLNAEGGFGASLFGVEEVVYLRGPNGLLYGATGSPGGMINLVTRKPLDTAMTRIDTRFGTYWGNHVSFGDRASASVDFDSTGPLGADGRVLYRLLATAEQLDYFTDDVTDRNRYGNLSLTFKLDADGRYQVTPIGQWSRTRRPAGGGLVISPSTSLATNDGIDGPIHTGDLSPLDVNLSDGDRIDEQQMAGVDVKTLPIDALRVNAGYRYLGFDTDINQFSPQVTSAAQRTLLTSQSLVQRVQTRSETERLNHNFAVDGTLETDPMEGWKNRTQLGMLGRLFSQRTATGGTLPPQSPINIYTGETTSPLVDADPPLNPGEWSDTWTWNYWLVNQASFDHDRFIVTLGVSYGCQKPEDTGTRRGDPLPNVGLLYHVIPELGLYASYAESFNPVDPASEDIDGDAGTFDPIKGKNYEVGAKLDLLEAATSFTLAFFRTEVNNNLVQSGAGDLNPNGNRYFSQAGRRRTDGVELTADVEPLKHWRWIGGATYLNGKYLGGGPDSASATTAIEGSPSEKTPKFSFSLLTRYDVVEGPLSGFGTSLGLVYQTERLGSNGARTPTNPDPLVLPAFFRMDLGFFYQITKSMDVALNVENVLDELIFANGTTGANLELAAPRTFTLRFGVQF